MSSTTISTIGNFPFCIQDVAEDGLPVEVWDGVTFRGGRPSKSSSQNITVVGEGTLFPVGLTLEEVMLMYWRVRRWNVNLNEDGPWSFSQDGASVDIKPDSARESELLGYTEGTCTENIQDIDENGDPITYEQEYPCILSTRPNLNAERELVCGSAPVGGELYWQIFKPGENEPFDTFNVYASSNGVPNFSWYFFSKGDSDSVPALFPCDGCDPGNENTGDIISDVRVFFVHELITFPNIRIVYRSGELYYPYIFTATRYSYQKTKVSVPRYTDRILNVGEFYNIAQSSFRKIESAPPVLGDPNFYEVVNDVFRVVFRLPTRDVTISANGLRQVSRTSAFASPPVFADPMPLLDMVPPSTIPTVIIEPAKYFSYGGTYDEDTGQPVASP
jgi:hypothetical protein